jgi:predicted ATPase
MEHGFIREVQLRREAVDDFGAYPFNIPAVKKLDRLRFDPRVTFLIGENGSGKSTLRIGETKAVLGAPQLDITSGTA